MSELLLLSGGIDSIAIAAWRRPKICLTIDYGQKPARAEIAASRRISSDIGLEHVVLSAQIPSLGVGDMAGTLGSSHSVHSEFWPFRNQYLITLAGAMALKHGCDTVLIGTVATDTRHKDGTPQFVSMITQLMMMQEGSIRASAPAQTLSSVELVQLSGVDLSVLGWAHSCHVGNLACNRCRGCQKHTEVMTQLGIER
jgi:7-cyano-7-deazaguanine synthase